MPISSAGEFWLTVAKGGLTPGTGPLIDFLAVLLMLLLCTLSLSDSHRTPKPNPLHSTLLCSPSLRTPEISLLFPFVLPNS
jgi:hypothetical protein